MFASITAIIIIIIFFFFGSAGFSLLPRLFSSCNAQGLLFVAVCGLLIVVGFSLHGDLTADFSSCRAQAQ